MADQQHTTKQRRRNRANAAKQQQAQSGKSSTTEHPADQQAGPAHLQLSDDDIYLFNEGRHLHLYRKMGAHPTEAGTRFAVWAPNARSVSVVGDFNGWSPGEHALKSTGASGIWTGLIPEAKEGAFYKYHVESQHHGYSANKADPYGFQHETPPQTASVVRDLSYQWSDDDWMQQRGRRHALDQPLSIYEVHIGSWMRAPENNQSLTYRDLAPRLAEYVNELGFTHVEFLPVMEHPFAGSWGYQVTGYFAPTSRFGTPQDFMYLIDYLHQHNIGVILDWVPSHFPTDEHGLQYFDGTHLYEHADPRQGFHPDWKSSIFNYGRNEVRSFLISNAIFWLDKYHIDGLRVDAVASMLYLDYSREDGEWIPNRYGGRENLDAIEFLRQLNADVYQQFPDVQTIAEESTAWPMVSRPTYVGGLGFGYKWDMGWMHDTLHYMSRDPIYRRFHHHELTFRAIYQFSENYVLPLSHDEVVHGKGSLLGKMPGDDWQRFANLRLLLSYMWAAPGKKMLFMGGDIAQSAEWNHDSSIDWHLLEYDSHRGVQRLIRELNRLYRDEPALNELDCQEAGFAWIDANDADQSCFSFMRYARDRRAAVAVVINATPLPRSNYRIGVPHEGHWLEIFNSDGQEFGGSGQGNLGGVDSTPTPFHGHPNSINLTLPPFAAVMLRFDPEHQPSS